MLELQFPINENHQDITNGYSELSQPEKITWIRISKDRRKEFEINQYEPIISFYLYELKTLEEKNPHMVRLIRKVQAKIGRNYQFLGKNSVTQPEKCIDAFQKGMIWYQKADETIHFYSHYAKDQANCAIDAARYRKLNSNGVASFQDEITSWLIGRYLILYAAKFNPSFIIINNHIPKGVEEIINEVERDLKRGYLKDFPYPILFGNDIGDTYEDLTTTSQELELCTELPSIDESIEFDF
ncbi:MAG: hypothetical protein ABIG93_00225 [archaeon]